MLQDDDIDSVWDAIQRYGVARSVGTIVILFILPISVCFLPLFLKSEALYAISVDSEIATLEVSDTPLKWHVEGPRVFDPFLDSGPRDVKSGILTLPVGTRIRLVLGRGDELEISIISGPGEQPVFAEAGSEGARIALDYGTSILLSAASLPWTVPFVGKVTVGHEVQEQASGTSPVLLQGKVSVSTKGFINRERRRFEAAAYVLAPGDRVALVDLEGGLQTSAGLIRLQTPEFLSVVTYGEADHALISRYGADPFGFQPTIWDELRVQPVFQVFVIVYLPLVTTLIWATRFVWRRHSNRETEQGE